VPDAWWITIPAVDFAFGAPLSLLTQQGIADALAAIRPLLGLSDAPNAVTRNVAVEPQSTRSAQRNPGTLTEIRGTDSRAGLEHSRPERHPLSQDNVYLCGVCDLCGETSALKEFGAREAAARDPRPPVPSG
jgi:hypothetical protein